MMCTKSIQFSLLAKQHHVYTNLTSSKTCSPVERGTEFKVHSTCSTHWLLSLKCECGKYIECWHMADSYCLVCISTWCCVHVVYMYMYLYTYSDIRMFANSTPVDAVCPIVLCERVQGFIQNLPEKPGSVQLNSSIIDWGWDWQSPVGMIISVMYSCVYTPFWQSSLQLFI